MNGEEWRPMPGHAGRYEVSSHGRVKSLPKRSVPEAFVMKLRTHRTGYPIVVIVDSGKHKQLFVHTLVARAFLGPRPEGDTHIRHMDGDKANNNIDNLRYGSRSDNSQDRRRMSEYASMRRTFCDNGHEFTPENTLITELGPLSSMRRCRTCYRAYYWLWRRVSKEEKARRRAAGLLIVDVAEHFRSERAA